MEVFNDRNLLRTISTIANRFRPAANDGIDFWPGSRSNVGNVRTNLGDAVLLTLRPYRTARR
jgi:hypothetical protein